MFLENNRVDLSWLEAPVFPYFYSNLSSTHINIESIFTTVRGFGSFFSRSDNCFRVFWATPLSFPAVSVSLVAVFSMLSTLVTSAPYLRTTSSESKLSLYLCTMKVEQFCTEERMILFNNVSHSKVKLWATYCLLRSLTLSLTWFSRLMTPRMRSRAFSDSVRELAAMVSTVTASPWCLERKTPVSFTHNWCTAYVLQITAASEVEVYSMVKCIFNYSQVKKHAKCSNATKSCIVMTAK